MVKENHSKVIEDECGDYDSYIWLGYGMDIADLRRIRKEFWILDWLVTTKCLGVYYDDIVCLTWPSHAV